MTPASAWLREPVAGLVRPRASRNTSCRRQSAPAAWRVVYKARDERLGRQVALKFLLAVPQRRAAAPSRGSSRRRARPRRSITRTSARSYEIGETDDGQLFIAMPLYEGETLQARLTRGRLTFDEALPIALQVARGLEHAHEAASCTATSSRPTSSMLPDGTAKILDFGIAQIHRRSDSSIRGR